MSTPTSNPDIIAELNASRAEFEHRLRQLNDIVERNGGAYGPVADEIGQVQRNLKDVIKELESYQKL